MKFTKPISEPSSLVNGGRHRRFRLSRRHSVTGSETICRNSPKCLVKKCCGRSQVRPLPPPEKEKIGTKNREGNSAICAGTNFLSVQRIEVSIREGIDRARSDKTMADLSRRPWRNFDNPFLLRCPFHFRVAGCTTKP